MKKSCLVGFVLFSFILFFGGASATLQVWSYDGVFGPGDIVLLWIFVENDSDEIKKFVLTEYILSDVYVETGTSTIIELLPGELRDINREFEVSENLPSGEYTYNVSLYFDDEIIDANSTSFEIAGTLERFEDISVISCGGIACDEHIRLFELGSPVFVKAFDFEGADLSGELTLPDFSTVPLVFAGGTTVLPALVIGEYSAEITASKAGYLDDVSYVDFEVIEEFPEVVDLTDLCNLDGVCNNGESYQDCPQDCPFGLSFTERVTEYVPLGVVTVFDFSEENVVVDDVELLYTRSGDVTLVVSRFFENPHGVDVYPDVSPGVEFAFVDVGFETGRSGNLLDVVVNFAVPKQWVHEERIDPYSVEVLMFEGGSWTALPTTFEGGSGDYFNYSITLDEVIILPITSSMASPLTGFGPGFGLLFLLLFGALASVLFVRTRSKSAMPILLVCLFVSVVLLSGCVGPSNVCGDGVCGVGETGCPQDCGGGLIKSEISSCGDGVCDSGVGEDSSTCPSDCLNANYSFAIVGQRS